MVGVILSVIADAIISVSLNLQKHAHNRNWDHAAGKPKRPFTRLPLWWVGMLLNVFGELGNLVAYGFAPASVVTPVGSVGVFCNAILASFFLKEPLRKRDLVGLCFIVAGVVLIVMGVPEAPGVLTAHVIAHEVMPHPRCWAYLLALSLGVAALLVLARLGYGKRYLLVYLLLCSLISSVTINNRPGVFRVPRAPNIKRHTKFFYRRNATGMQHLRARRGQLLRLVIPDLQQ